MLKNISVVVLNYGYHQFLGECLSALNSVEMRDRLELILVENGSSRPDRARVEAELEHPAKRVDRLICLSENRGFARGMNAGIDAAKGDLVVALNADARVGKRLLVCLHKACTLAGARTGFFSVPVYRWIFEAGRSTLSEEWQGDVCALNSYLALKGVRRGRLRNRYIIGPSGCAVVMTRELVSDLKKKFGWVYDPGFFMYGEDVDLFLRARSLGYTTLAVEGSPANEDVIWHIGSGSGGGPGPLVDRSPEVVRRALDGMRRNMANHCPWFEFPILISVQIVFRIVMYLWYAGRWSLAGAWRLFRARRAQITGPARRRTRRSSLTLIGAIGLAYERSLPWARERDPVGGFPNSLTTIMPSPQTPE